VRVYRYDPASAALALAGAETAERRTPPSRPLLLAAGIAGLAVVTTLLAWRRGRSGG
jgi:hypothetical protein